LRLTKPGEIYTYQGDDCGLTDLQPHGLSGKPALWYHLCHLLNDMGGANDYKVDVEDEVVSGCLGNPRREVMAPPKPSAPPEQPSLRNSSLLCLKLTRSRRPRARTALCNLTRLETSKDSR